MYRRMHLWRQLYACVHSGCVTNVHFLSMYEDTTRVVAIMRDDGLFFRATLSHIVRMCDLVYRLHILGISYTELRYFICDFVRILYQCESRRDGIAASGIGINVRRSTLIDSRNFLLKLHRKIITTLALFACSHGDSCVLLTFGGGTTVINRDRFDCLVCGRAFFKTFHYLQHIRMHYRLGLYRCDRCGRTFVQLNGLAYHRKFCGFPTPVIKGKNFTVHDIECAKHYELCVSCGKLIRVGSVMLLHVIRRHARCNIDLGINKTQQLRLLKKILIDSTV